MFSSLAEGTIVVKIENTIFTFYFDIRFSIFIVAIFQSGSNPASIYLFKITKETLEKREICSKLRDTRLKSLVSL